MKKKSELISEFSCLVDLIDVDSELILEDLQSRNSIFIENQDLYSAVENNKIPLDDVTYESEFYLNQKLKNSSSFEYLEKCYDDFLYDLHDIVNERNINILDNFSDEIKEMALELGEDFHIIDEWDSYCDNNGRLKYSSQEVIDFIVKDLESKYYGERSDNEEEFDEQDDYDSFGSINEWSDEIEDLFELDEETISF
eukprot:gene4130-7440_t